MQEEIINSWINYIDLERLEKTKLNPASINTKNFFNFDNIKEQIDTITLDFNKLNGLVQSLKKDFPIEKDEDDVDQKTLYLYFPLIQTQDQWGEILHPLFAIDITHQKYELYSSGKLYLLPYKEADYIPLVASFKRFLGVSEDAFLENLPLNQILGRVLGQNFTTFQESFSALKKYINGNLLAGKLHTQDCILGYADMENHGKKLRDELLLLREANLATSPLAAQYLSHAEGDAPLEELGDTDLWRGSFNDTFPLSKGQGDVLRKLDRGDDLLAVQGAPGSGKTTLFMSIIANRIVDRAINLANTGQDKNNLMIVVSTSNKAVGNVVEQFQRDKKIRPLNHFYFIGGKRDNILSSLPRLEKFIAELKSKTFDPNRHEKARLNLLNAVEELDHIQSNYSQKKEDLRNIQTKGANRFGGGSSDTWKAWLDAQNDSFFEEITEIGYKQDSNELKDIGSWLNERLQEIATYEEELSTLQRKYPYVTISLFDPDSPDLKKAIDDLRLLSNKMSTLPFWQLESLFKKKAELFVDWVTRYGFVLKDILKDFYNYTYKEIPDLISLFNLLLHDLASLKKKKPANSLKTTDLQQLVKFVQQHEKEQEEIVILLNEYNKLKEEVSSFEQPTFTDFYRQQTVREQRQLFDLSMTFLNEEMVRRKTELIGTLRDWTDLIAHNNGRWITQKWSEMGFGHHFSLLSLAYPVLTSTLASYNNFFHDFFYLWKEKQVVVNRIEEEKPVHLVLSDESGMSGVHTLFPLLYKSEKAVIVGDPLQLEPITQAGSNQAYIYEHDNFSKAALAAQYSPVSVTAYHRAAGCKTGRYDDIGKGLVLDEHRRCQPAIANVFIDVANYSSLKVQSAPLKGESQDRLERFGGKSLVFYDIEGKKGEWRNTNVNEIEAIDRILDKLGAAGYQINKDVCIITPFNTQEQLLIKKFGQRLHHTSYGAKIGTIHKLQGVEFDVVIFSPVISSSKDSSWFLNAKPNIINVAVSRAKHMFITCGNFQRLSSAGGYLEKLCQHHQEHGYLLEGTPDDQTQNREEMQSIDYLDTCTHLQYFEKALREAQDELVIISPWLGTSRHHVQQLNWIKDAMERKVQVQVYYGWKQDDNSDEAIHQYRKVLGNNLIRVPQSTHEKCLIQDRKEMAIGSFNWLSHRYGEYCQQENSKWTRASIRRESSVIVRESNVIEEVLHGLM